ncbi:MAG: Na+:solute symporter [Flavobacteriales bacterium]|jgi:Na+/proline symporter|nr:Na+:solute symporter [Flavobacteriales bacterium]
MDLHLIDWAIIIALLLLSLLIGFAFKKRASKGFESFILGGRKFPWFLAGISMVATTFAADTPLVVVELVAQNGISGNWIWWAGLIGGMFTTFFFASLWRRSGVLTEVELIELRYGGRNASILRGVKAVYLGLIMNVAVIAWVNNAMVTILQVFFEVDTTQIWWILMALMLFASFYSSLGGLWGIAVTDAVQFVFAMVASVVLAYFVLDTEQVGGLSGLVNQLPSQHLSFFPKVSSVSDVGFSISLGAFIAFVGVQWWSSWYPGAEPGGGGYVAQRMMSTKTEKDSVLATLLFQVAHYALRPWPWILVALSGFVLYPELMETAPKKVYVLAMKNYLPVGFKGLLLASFLAAYLSTISTQLNWGASFLSNDFYKRFIRPAASSKDLVKNARIMTVLLAVLGGIISMYITTISDVWVFVLECGAGLGFILILRWYWWRISATTEIIATVAPFLFYSISRFWLEPMNTTFFVDQKGTFFITVLGTVLVSLISILFTKPEKRGVLENFYHKVQPSGFWGEIGGNSFQGLGFNVLAWISGVLFVYSSLFSVGYFLFNDMDAFKVSIAILIGSLIIFSFAFKRIKL